MGSSQGFQPTFARGPTSHSPSAQPQEAENLTTGHPCSLLRPTPGQDHVQTNLLLGASQPAACHWHLCKLGPFKWGGMKVVPDPHQALASEASTRGQVHCSPEATSAILKLGGGALLTQETTLASPGCSKASKSRTLVLPLEPSTSPRNEGWNPLQHRTFLAATQKPSLITE